MLNPRSDDRLRYAAGGVEPTLQEVLTDPVVKTMMQADGIGEVEILALYAQMGRNGAPLCELALAG